MSIWLNEMCHFQLKPIPVSLSPLVVRVVIAIATETWNLFNCEIVNLTPVCLLHCRLRDNDLTATGAIALAKTLEHNQSLEELK